MVKFHHEHGHAIQVTDDSHRATRTAGWGSHWAYSHRPLNPGEVVCLRVTKLATVRAKKPCCIGLTSQDPNQIRVKLNAEELMCHTPYYFPDECVAIEKTIQIYYEQSTSDHKAYVFFGADRIPMGLAMKTDNVQQVWLAVRLGGSVESVDVYDSDMISSGYSRDFRVLKSMAGHLIKTFMGSRTVNRGTIECPRPILKLESFDKDVIFRSEKLSATIRGKTKVPLLLFFNRAAEIKEFLQFRLSAINPQQKTDVKIRLFVLPQRPTETKVTEAQSNMGPITMFFYDVQTTNRINIDLYFSKNGTLIQGNENRVVSSTSYDASNPAWVLMEVKTSAAVAVDIPLTVS